MEDKTHDHPPPVKSHVKLLEEAITAATKRPAGQSCHFSPAVWVPLYFALFSTCLQLIKVGTSTLIHYSVYFK